jgi:hypothetical protein
MRLVILILLTVGLVLFGTYLFTVISPENVGGADRARLIQDSLVKVSYPLWEFARPLLQLALLLLILDAMFKRIGFRWQFEGLGITWDIRSLIAIIVVSAFSIAALSGSQASESLKDVALVVIGFYFGGLERLKVAQIKSEIKAAADKTD